MKKTKNKSKAKKRILNISQKSIISEIGKLLRFENKFKASLQKLHYQFANLKNEYLLECAVKFISELEREQNYIQEMIEWYYKAKSQNDSSVNQHESLEEIFILVESFIEHLNEKYLISPIYNPGTIITQLPKPKNVIKFAEKNDPSVTSYRVIHPGLKVGKKIIVPSLISRNS